MKVLLLSPTILISRIIKLEKLEEIKIETSESTREQ
jgi:hypothetical protein